MNSWLYLFPSASVHRKCSVVIWHLPHKVLCNYMQPLQSYEILKLKQVSKIYRQTWRVFAEPVTIIIILISCVLKVPQSSLDLDGVKSILAEYRIHNADITLRCDATADDIIDIVEGNRYSTNIIHTTSRVIISLLKIQYM